jgi:uncharacterized membrane protein
MPLGNVTKMTDGERDVLARWIAQGAKIITITVTP